MHLVLFYDAQGNETYAELDHLPTQADIPAGTVRMDVALPYQASESHAERMQRLSDGVRLAMATDSPLALI